MQLVPKDMMYIDIVLLLLYSTIKIVNKTGRRLHGLSYMYIQSTNRFKRETGNRRYTPSRCMHGNRFHAFCCKYLKLLSSVLICITPGHLQLMKC